MFWAMTYVNRHCSQDSIAVPVALVQRQLSGALSQACRGPSVNVHATRGTAHLDAAYSSVAWGCALPRAV